MNLFKKKKYWWEEDEEENQSPTDWSVRQELEKQFQNPIHDKSKMTNPFEGLDTSNMNLRQELEAKFKALNDNNKSYPTKMTPDLFQNNSFKNEDDNDFDQNMIKEKEDQNPYIFSKEMRNLLGEIESGNNYSKVNSEGGGFGALGKYQIRRDGFKDMGYIDQNNQWIGKNNIYSNEDYLNNDQAQEKALDDFMQVKYKQLKNNGSHQYLDYPIKGIVGNFDITDTGLLAASHREGAGAVHNYLSHLEKDQNGHYHIDYDKIQDPKMRAMFKRIETRLRRFAK